MVRSHSFAWILVSLLSLTLAAPLQADITPSGDVNPSDHSWWTGGGDINQDACVGWTDAGSVTVNLGSNLSSYKGYIGRYSTGVVTVDGSGSTWTNSGGLTVGNEGLGTLNITNGGVVSSSYGSIGSCDSGSTDVVTVDGTGSTWTCNQCLYIGDGDEWSGGGHGTLNIINGGAVSNSNGNIGYWSGSTGEVTVDGNGSIWTNSGSLYIGGDETLGVGTAVVTVENNGQISVDETLKIWGGETLNIGAAGQVTIGSFDNTTGGTFNWTNGTLRFADSLTIDSATPFNAAGADGDKITANRTLEVANNLIISGSGTGTLNIQDGGTVSSAWGYIGYEAGATGEVTVDGSGSTWTNSSNLCVGYRGQGTLNITNGGAVSNNYGGYIGHEAGSTGVVTVDGSGSTLTNSSNLSVGYEGHGTLNITNGGTVSNNYGGYIGYEAGATGEVTVDGSGSTWTNSGNLCVGYRGQGTLNIINGGSVVSNTYGDIGFLLGSNGIVTVDGSGSTWTNNDDLYVGYEGQGTLNITNSGAVSNSDGYIGYFSRSTGEVTVDGSGSTWTNSGYFSIGEDGHGTLNIINGGAVSNSDGYIGYGSRSTGVVTVDGSGSTWTNSGDLYVGGGDFSAGGTGELTLSNGGSVEVGDMLKVWNPGTVNLTGGTLTADSINHTEGGAFNFTGGRLNVGTFYGNLVNNSGTLAPGISPGTTNIQGNYTQAAGAAMEIEIGGLSAGTDYDQVVITGGATLAGTLDLSLIGEYVPDFYDEFVILTAGTLNSMFDTITGYSVSPDMSLAVVYNADNVTIVAAIPGDATLNGYVDGGDLDILLADWGKGVPPANYRADLSGNFFVDGDDLDLILADWGKGVPPPVPEPASATLLLLGAVAMLKRRRKLY